MRLMIRRGHLMTWLKSASWKLYIASAVYCAVVFADCVCWSAAGCRGIGLEWIRISLVSFRNSQNAGCRLYYSGVMSALKHLKLYLSQAWANSLTLEVGPGVLSLWLVLSINLTLTLPQGYNTWWRWRDNKPTQTNIRSYANSVER